MKRLIIKGVACVISLSILTFTGVSSFAASPSLQKEEANIVIATNGDIALPDNVKVRANPVKYDHNYGVSWPAPNKRYCWGNTQAKQGTIRLDSYTRARFERIWGVYGDSNRQWSTGGGRSYAQSATESYDSLSSGKAKTYYGIS